MLKDYRWLLAVSLTTLMLGWLWLAFPAVHAQSEEPGIPVVEPTQASWQQAIALIERDRVAGILSTDEAALLRFAALTDWQELPPQYHPTGTLALSATEALTTTWHEAPPDQAAKVAALFHDYQTWEPTTYQAIVSQMEQAEQAYQQSFNERLTTTHFLIHWDSSGGANTPTGCTPTHCPYISRIALSLESISWDRLASYGYAMPEPAVFNQSRLDVYVADDIGSCSIFPGPEEGGIAWPGAIKLTPHMISNQLIPILTHELYHLIQWHYVGFHGTDCADWSMALLWYEAGNKWLMEDTATWAEHEVHGALVRAEGARYRASVRDYLQVETNHSLFEVVYNGALFFRYLQEHIAPHAGYSNTRDINLEVWQVLSDTAGPSISKYTVEAMTTVIEGFPAPYEKWQPLFADFARTNYFKDYDFATTLFAGVQVPLKAELPPVANPSYPLEDNMGIDLPPAALYYEIHPDALNIAGGADATGATLHLRLTPACGHCDFTDVTLDTLFYRHGALLTHTATLLDYTFEQTLTTDFASASGVTSVTLILANAPPRTPPAEGDLWLTATDNPPIAPAALTATTPPAGGITLAWSPVHETGIRYVIERQDWQHTTTLATVSTPTLGYSDQSAQVGTVYRYRVRALDTGGNMGPPTAVVQALICPTPQPLLLVYLLDASSSMQERFVGTTSKLDAAKQAIHAGNALLRTWNNRSRAGLVVVQASPMLGPPHYRSLISPTTYHTAPTTNLTALETELARVAWYGNSPLAHALRFGRATLRAAHPADPTQRPVLLWLTDGQPTVSHENTLGDYWGYPFLDEDVQAVPLRDGTGIYRPISAIRASGSHYPRYDLYAGEPLADVMDTSHDLRAARPAPTLHAIEVQNPLVSSFEEGLLPYVADIGGGLGAAPATLDLLTLATLQALAHSACLPTVSPSPTATPTTPPGPRPTPTP